MVAESRVFGHKVIYDIEIEEWVYADNREIVNNTAITRKCPQCNNAPTKEGYDPCFGEIPGVRSACCGHGIEKGFILWDIDNNWYDDERSIFRKHYDLFLNFLTDVFYKTKEIETSELKF